jgi:hypothetical protein
MSDIEIEFLSELDSNIRSKKASQMKYKYAQVTLMTIIAGCGFLTAAASQAGGKAIWLSSPTFLLLAGLLSALCAIVNQVVNPGERATYQRSGKKALEIIRIEFKYKGMPIREAAQLRAIALTNPDMIIGAPVNTHKPKAE